MGYIHAVEIDEGQTHLIEPLLFATAAGTSTALTAAINNFTLVNGVYVNIKVGEVGDNATLNVNGTGAKNIYYNNIAISPNMLSPNHIYTFIYDGTNWTILGDIIGTNVLINTTAGWQAQPRNTYPSGTILIYSDRGTVTETVNNVEITKTVPGVKISDGSTPIIDLAFVGDDVIAAVRAEINSHVNDNIRHITANERSFWNNKINCDNTLTSHTLIITRN